MSQRPAHAHGRGSFDIPSLDGLRAVSFLLVFLGHAGLPGIPGGFGVTVFFFLSGYLITTLLRLEVEKTGTLSFRLFYLRRALRIWPPFYLVLLVCNLLAASGVIGGELEAPSVLAQALHYSNYWIAFRGWDGIAAGTGVYWSLAVEEHFYLLFPAFYWTLLRADLSPRQQRTAFLAICGLVLVWRAVLVFGFHPIGDRTYVATDTRLDSLLFGCGLAVFENPALDLERKARPEMRDFAFLGAGLAALLSSFVIRDPTFRETLRYTIQGLGLYPVFVTAVRFPDYGPLKLLGTAPMRYLGKISYSLYLMHHVVLEGVGRHMPESPVLHAVVSLGVSVAAASLVWYLVEEPCAVVRRKLAARGATAVASAGPGAAAARATRT